MYRRHLQRKKTPQTKTQGHVTNTIPTQVHEVEPQEAAPDLTEQILQLQRQYGNSAVQRMLKAGTLPVNLPGGGTNSARLQRMPAVGTAQTMLPVSKKKTAKRHRETVLNKIQEFFTIIDNYAANFPDTPTRLKAEAQTYYDDTLNQLNGLSTDIDNELKTYKTYFSGIPGRFSTKSTKRKYAGRAQNVEDFGFKVDKKEGEKHLAPLHQKLYMQVMTADPNLNFLDETKRTAVGTGTASGTVNVVGKATYDVPGKGPMEGFSKTDIAATSDPGADSGIKKESANMGLRSVATFEVSELIGLGIVPVTALTKFTGTDGSVQTGQFMETAKGTSGFRDSLIDLGLNPTDQAKLNTLFDQYSDPENSSKEKQAFSDKIYELSRVLPGMMKKDRNGDVKKFQNAIANFDYKDPEIQKHLATLQTFDNIVGHGDRHAGNYFLEHARGDKDNVTGIKAIDNDDTFGGSFTGDKVGRMGKTKALPQVLDGEVALKILGTKWDDLKAILEKYGMNQQEIDATQSRWAVVVDHVKNLVRTDKIAVDSGGDPVIHNILLTQLYHEMGETLPDNKVPAFMNWGDDTKDFFTQNNSYSGRESDTLSNARRFNNREIYEPN